MKCERGSWCDTWIHAWPLDGIAAGWILDLERGIFGELRPAMGYGAALRLFGFEGFRPPAVRRGAAAVRLEVAFEEDEEIPDDDEVEIPFITDVALDWSELVEADGPGSAGRPRPLVRLPGREPVACTSLTFPALEAAFGPPALSEEFDADGGQWLHEWMGDGFYVTATTYAEVLAAVGISSVSLDGRPALRAIR